MKMWKKITALLLAFMMVLGSITIPGNTVTAEAAEPNIQYKVFHLDAARKYFSLNSLKSLVDMAANAGYNQFNLYLSDDQGFRIKLNDMTVVTGGKNYDLSDCVGDGFVSGNGIFAPCGVDGEDSRGYLTEEDIKELISYARTKNIEICPTINTPAHMGAILEDLKYSDGSKADLRADTYGSGLSAIKLTDSEGIEFISALTKKFITFFANQGCKFYCIGGDEYKDGYPSDAGYDNFVTYVTDMNVFAKSKNMKLRMFNDSFTTGGEWTKLPKDVEIYYWSVNPGSGTRAKPEELLNEGYNLINTPDVMYYVLRDSNNPWWMGTRTEEQIAAWSYNMFWNGNWESTNNINYLTVNDKETEGKIVGATMCVWCDNGNGYTTDNIIAETKPLAKAFAVQAGSLPADGGDGGDGGNGGEQLFPEIEYNYGNGSGVTFNLYQGQSSGSFKIKSDRPLKGADFTVAEWSTDASAGAADQVVSVQIVKTEIVPGKPVTNKEVITSVASGDKFYIGDGTNFLTVTDAGDQWNHNYKLSTTTDISAAYEWTVVSISNWQGSYLALATNLDGTAHYLNPNFGLQNWTDSTAHFALTGGLLTTDGKYFDLETMSFVSEQPAKPVTGYKLTDGGVSAEQVITTVQFNSGAIGRVKYSLTGISAVENEDKDDYFFDITVVPLDPDMHVHHGGQATCESQAVCEECDKAYGSVATKESVAAQRGDWHDPKWHDAASIQEYWQLADGTTVTNATHRAGKICINCNTVLSYPGELASGEIKIIRWITNLLITESGTPEPEGNPYVDSACDTITMDQTATDTDGTTYSVGSEDGAPLELLLTPDSELQYSPDGSPVRVQYITGTLHPWGHWQFGRSNGSYHVGNNGDGYGDTDLFVEWNKVHDPDKTAGALDKTLENAKEDYGLSEDFGVKKYRFIRYYNDAWWVTDVNPENRKADGSDWIEVDTSEKGDMLAARYMHVTDVTEEITTLVQDWGILNGAGGKEQYVNLDFAVHYASGDVRPEQDDKDSCIGGENHYAINGKTITYQADDTMTKIWFDEDGTRYRWVDNIIAENSSDREVYMITLKPTIETNITYNQKYHYDEAQEKIVWLISPDTPHPQMPLDDEFMWGYAPEAGKTVEDYPELGENFTDENLHSFDESYGIPLVRQVFIENRTGMLVTYWMRAKEDSKNVINVHYMEGTSADPDTTMNGATEFAKYGIVVNSGTTFNTEFAKDFTKDFALLNNTVVNDLGVTQTVNPALYGNAIIPAKYRYGEYAFIQAVRSEDGKDVYLYYYTAFEGKDIVIDFGLPVQITPKLIGLDEVNIDDVTNFEIIGSKQVEGVDETLYECTYGTIYNPAGSTCVYVPNKVMKGVETLKAKLTYYDGTVSAEMPFRIIPATTMYYESSMVGKTSPSLFVNYEDKGTDAKEADYWTLVNGSAAKWYGSPDQRTQEGANPGDTQKETGAADVYGFDEFYEIADVINNQTYAVTTNKDAFAEFEFVGDGVEIYANTTTKTANVYVGLLDKDDNLKKLMVVDTHMEDGEVENGPAAGQNVNGVNVPIVSITGLNYGTYKVLLMPMPSKEADGTKKIRDDGFRFDGFRVLNTMGNSMDAVYALDKEAHETFIDLRDTVIATVTVPDNYDGQYKDQIGSSQVWNENIGAVMTNSGEIQSGTDEVVNEENIIDLLDNGPKNEIYLKNGQSFIFGVNPDEYDVQVGMKTLTTPATGEKSPTDMYYTVTPDANNIVTITNNQTNILSITKVKLIPKTQTETPAEQAQLMPMTAKMFLAAVDIEDGSSVETPEVPDPSVHGKTPETAQEYLQPTGAHDAYQKGEFILYNGQIYECKKDSVVWNPTDYPQGWKKVNILAKNKGTK